MAFNYPASAVTATALITQFGQTITHASVTEGVYDPATGTVGTTTANQTGIGVLLEYSVKESGVMQASGVLVTANTRKLLLSVSGMTVAPMPNDTVTVAGIVYTVEQVKTLKPSDTVVMYELRVTR